MPGSSVASETDKIPKSTFEIYRTEGDALFRSGEYKKAITCYTQALELRPGDRHCLVTRSKCHLFKGDIVKALVDAEASLEEDKNFHKGIYQKAEVLYFKGDFENALIFFHRGYRLRPEMEDFRRGIQKCEEAINNAVGDPNVVKLRSDGDLSHFYKADEDEKSKKKQTRAGYMKPKAGAGQAQRAERKKVDADDRTIRTLLGELYADREYLEMLLKEEETRKGRKNENSEKIRELAINGLNYLDARSEFWQEQQPMYSRKRDRHLRTVMSASSGSAGGPSAAVKYVIVNLDAIDEKQSRGEHEAVLKHATKMLKQVNAWSQTDLPNKVEVLANLYSVIGNSYLELAKFTKALEFHEKDLALGKAHNIIESVSRAMDNIGRAYAKKGDYKKAIEIWEEKIPRSKSPLESTWLHHEIGRCYLQLGNYSRAKSYGEKSLACAKEAGDESWELNACVLIAEAETSMEEYQAACASFEKSLDYARSLGNKNAENAIQRALQSINTKIIEKTRAEEKALKAEEGKESDRVVESDHSTDHLSKENKTPAQGKDSQESPEPEAQDEPTHEEEPPSPSPKEETPRESPNETIQTPPAAEEPQPKAESRSGSRLGSSTPVAAPPPDAMDTVEDSGTS